MGPSPKSRAPITYQLLTYLIQSLPLGPTCALDRSLLTFGFYGALRGSEYTAAISGTGQLSAPKLNQVQFVQVGDSIAYVYTMPTTKTTSQPISINVGCSGTYTCAPCLLRHYLFDRQCTLGLHPESYLFALPNGRPVTKDYLNKLIKTGMSALGIDKSLYSSHSLRSGAATTAGQTGFNEVEIKLLGHWSSSAYSTYVHNKHLNRFHFSSRLATQHL